MSRIRTLLAATALLLATRTDAMAKVPTKLPDDPVAGRDLYQDHCWQCHGVEGQGDGPLASLLQGSSMPSLRGRAELEWPGLIDVVLAGRGDMPAYSVVMGRPDARRVLVWLAALDAGESDVPPTRQAPTPSPDQPEPGSGDQETGSEAARGTE